MGAPVLIEHLAVRDRYITAGAAQLDLAALMVPEGMPAPANCSILWTSGTAGHHTLAGNLLSSSATGDAADMASGTYVGTVTFTFAPYAAPDNVGAAQLTIIYPTNSVYVAETGVDTAAGTMNAPWAHSPDDPLATGNAAAHVASSLTAVVHKNGSVFRSSLAPKSTNRWNIGDQGWGSGGKARYTGADALGVGTAASSGDVFANPNVANIKKWTIPAGKKKSQWLIDRNAPTEAQGLLFWAQWPAAGADPYIQSFGIQRGEADGMFRVAPSTFAVNGANSTWTVPPELLAKHAAEFGSADLTGAYIGFPASEGSFMSWFPITGWDGVNKRATFDIGTSIVKAAADNLTSVQIVGHPRSIKGPGQFGHLVGSTSIFAHPNEGSSVELMTRKRGVDAVGVLDGAVYGLAFDGYFGDTSDVEGGVVTGGQSTTYSFDMLECDTRWLVSHQAAGGMYRMIGIGTNDGSVVQGNTCNYTIGTAMVRHGTAANGRYRRNSGLKFSATAFYIPNIKASCIIEFNKFVDGYGPHANGMSFYSNPERALIRFNKVLNFVRPLTVQDDVSGIAFPGLQFIGNVWGRDRFVEDGSRIYGPRHTFYRDMFLRDPGAPAGTTMYSLSVSAGAACTFTNCIIDQMIGGQDATFINCLKVGQSWYDPVLIENNVAPNSGNVYEPYAWNGTVPARWKQVVGAGNSGREYLYGIAVIPGLANISGADVSSPVESPWLGPITADYAADITLTNCQMRTNSSASDTGATAYTATPGNAVALSGKYIRLKMTTGSAFDANNTATINLGNGNVYTWTVRTKQAAGFPLVVMDATNDYWRPSAAIALGAADTKTLTLGFFGNLASVGNDTLIGGWAGGTTYRVMVKLIPNRFRVQIKRADGTDIANFDGPSFAPYLGANMMLLMTIDLNQATSAAGVKTVCNGIDLGAPNSTTTWSTGETINWTYATTLHGAFQNLVNGKVGMLFCDRGWVDITDANVRDKFNAHRIGTNGENIMGRTPDNFFCGVVADWMSATPGFNRGTAGKMLKQGSTDVTLDSGGAQAWPAYSYATALTNLIGPPAQVGEARTYNITVNGALANPKVVTLSDGGAGGTFTPSTLTFDPATGPATKSFTYQPTTAGGVNLSATASGLTAGTLATTADPLIATAYTLSFAKTTAAVGEAVGYTITLNGSNPGGVAIDPGLFGIEALISPDFILPPGVTELQGTITPLTAGVGGFTPVSVLLDPATTAFTSTPAPNEILPGQTVTLTAEQFATLKVVSDGGGPAAGLGPIQFRWKRNSGESGPTDGADVLVTVT